MKIYLILAKRRVYSKVNSWKLMIHVSYSILMYTHLIFQKKIEWVLHKSNSIKFIVTFECKMEHLKCANFSTLFLHWRSVIPIMSWHQNSLKFRRVESISYKQMIWEWRIFVCYGKHFFKDIDIQKIRLEAKWKYFGKIKHGENWI